MGRTVWLTWKVSACGRSGGRGWLLCWGRAVAAQPPVLRRPASHLLVSTFCSFLAPSVLFPLMDWGWVSAGISGCKFSYHVWMLCTAVILRHLAYLRINLSALEGPVPPCLQKALDCFTYLQLSASVLTWRSPVTNISQRKLIKSCNVRARWGF